MTPKMKEASVGADRFMFEKYKIKDPNGKYLWDAASCCVGGNQGTSWVEKWSAIVGRN
jgi:hypothetical protein